MLSFIFLQVDDTTKPHITKCFTIEGTELLSNGHI